MDGSEEQAAEVAGLAAEHFATCELLEEFDENSWIGCGRVIPQGGSTDTTGWFDSPMRVIVAAGAETVHVFGPNVAALHCRSGRDSPFELLPWDRHADLPAMVRMTADTGAVIDIEMTMGQVLLDPLLTPAEVSVAAVRYGCRFSDLLLGSGEDVSTLVEWKTSVAHLDRARQRVETVDEVIEGSLDYFCEPQVRPEAARAHAVFARRLPDDERLVKVATVRLHEPARPTGSVPRYVHLAVTDKRLHLFGPDIAPCAEPTSMGHFDVIQLGSDWADTADVVKLYFRGEPTVLVEFHVPEASGGFTFAQWIWFVARERNGACPGLSDDVRRGIAFTEFRNRAWSQGRSLPASTTRNTARAIAAPPEPATRLLRTPRDGEEVAAEWMTWMGLGPATATQASRDGGVDVVSSVAAGQVKMEMVKTTRPTLQKLFGAARADSKAPVFFSLNGYTKDAIGWADHARVALFTFDFQGEPYAANEIARKLMSAARIPGLPAQRGPRALSCFDPAR